MRQGGDASWKWLLGGCIGCFGIIAVCGGILAYFTPRLISQGKVAFKKAIAESQRRQQFAQDWRPPDNEIATLELFPARVGNFDRTDLPTATIAWQDELEGVVCRYRSSSTDDEIDIFVGRASELEKEAIVARVSESLKSQSNQLKVTAGDSKQSRFFYSMRPPLRKGLFWWNRGWLIYFHSETDVEFDDVEVPFLEAIEGTGPEDVLESADPESVDPGSVDP